MLDGSDSGVDVDGNTISVAHLVSGSSEVDSIQVKSTPAGDWELNDCARIRNDDGGVDLGVTVIVVVTTASGDFVVSRNASASVIKLKRATDGVVDTLVGADLLSSDVSREGRALSVARHGSSSEVEGGGSDSNVAHKLLSWKLGRVLGGIDTSIVGTTAGLQTVLDGVTVVDESHGLASGSWIT